MKLCDMTNLYSSSSRVLRMDAHSVSLELFSLSLWCANTTSSQVEMDDNLRIWRSFSIGSLLDIIMLDTRQYDRSITDLYWNTDYVHSISNDAGRSLMGSRQENWFYSQLIGSKKRGAAWRVIGSQIGVCCRVEKGCHPADIQQSSLGSTSQSPTGT